MSLGPLPSKFIRELLFPCFGWTVGIRQSESVIPTDTKPYIDQYIPFTDEDISSIYQLINIPITRESTFLLLKTNYKKERKLGKTDRHPKTTQTNCIQ